MDPLPADSPVSMFLIVLLIVLEACPATLLTGAETLLVWKNCLKAPLVLDCDIDGVERRMPGIDVFKFGVFSGACACTVAVSHTP